MKKCILTLAISLALTGCMIPVGSKPTVAKPASASHGTPATTTKKLFGNNSSRPDVPT